MRVLLILLSLILIMPSVFAFDGQRKGFVIGGGLGYSPYVSVSTNGPYTWYEGDFDGYNANIHLGYSWDEQNSILFEMDVTGSENEDFVYRDFGAGFFGPVWYHYFKGTGKSFCTIAGIGNYLLTVTDNSDFDHEYKIGLVAGVGYEFIRHFQLSAKYIYGKTDFYGSDFNHNNLLITLTGSFY